jgi:hypothetical protein
MKRLSCLIGILGVALAVQAAALACPFCDSVSTPTLMEDYKEADLIVFGRIENAQVKDFTDGSTDLIIEEIIKPHPMLKDKKKLVIPRYIQQMNLKFLVFGRVYKDSLDPFRGVSVKGDSDMLAYMRGAIKLKDAPAPERLRHAFDFLESKEAEVSQDAYREFAKADYTEYRDMAKKLPPDLIAGWLEDPKTYSYRYGLYSSLLGHCGTAKHAHVLKSMIADPEKNRNSGLAGMLSGYVMLVPKEGKAMLENLILDGKQEFALRYGVLQSLRFFHTYRPDLIAKSEVEEVVAKLANNPDMADFAIEDLRKWQSWKRTPEVLSYFELKTHQVPVIRRAIMRYALQSPHADAKTFVESQRKRDAEWVADTEELLRLEIGSENLPNGLKK